MSFYSTESNAQNINSITITSPIACYGGSAIINIQINQTNPATSLKVIVGYYIGSTFIPITSTNNTTVSSINVPSIPDQTYTILLVDSITYYSPPQGTGPIGANGQDPASIYDSSGVDVIQPLQLRNTADQDINLLCFGDSNASVTVNIFGGTPPFTISFDGGASVTLPLTTFTSSYNNLSAGNYSIFVTDANGCLVNTPSPSIPPSPTSITITEPDELIPNGSVTSDYNGEDISCFGAADGEITASVSGGTTPYRYSIDNGSTFQSSAVFSGLSAGTYTIYYIDTNKGVLSTAFCYENKIGCYLYNSSRNNEFNSVNPGIVLNDLIIQLLIEKELSFFDFLKGTERYKYDLGGKSVQLYDLIMNI